MYQQKCLITILLIFMILTMPIFITNNGYVYAGTRNKSAILKVKKGTDFDIALQNTINSTNLKENDTIAASLEENFFFQSKLIAPQGSIVYGKVLKVKQPRGFYGKGYLQIVFDEIMLPNGDIINFSGNVINIKARGIRALRISGDILLGTIAGALAGSQLPAFVPVGAAVGLLLATLEIADTKGLDVELPAGTMLTIRLVKPLKIHLS